MVRALLTPRGWAAGVLATLAMIVAISAHAHETWLVPRAFRITPGGSIELELTSAMTFPIPEHAIAPDRIAVALARTGDATVPLAVSAKDARYLRLIHHKTGPGLVTMWISLKPRTTDLTDAQVEEYFEEIGASKALRALWQQRRGKEKWKETYVKHAKTFVIAGDTRNDRSVGQPVGLPLEPVPESSATDLQSGDRFRVRLLKRGTPLAGAAVGLMIEGDSRHIFATTASDGTVAFQLTRPGRALVYTVDLRRTARDDAWESDFTTLVVAVGRGSAKP